MCSWISYFGTIALLAFAFFEFLLAFIFVSVVARIAGRRARSVSYAFLWVAFEWILAHFPIVAFSWLSLSTTAVNISQFRIFSRVGGGALITFLIVLTSSLMATRIRDRRTEAPRKSKIVRMVFVVMLCTAVLVLEFSAHITLGAKPTTVTVSTIQGNDKDRYLTHDEIVNRYLQHSHIDLAKTIKAPRDIIIFPESAFTKDPQTDKNLHSELTPIAKKASRLMILNAIVHSPSGHYINRNYFYSPSMDLLGHYDKRRLVPFGEYVPFKSIIGSWSIFSRVGSGFTPGNRDTTIRNVTTLICYESTFTDDVHRALNKKSKLLVITTNNRSYRRSGNSRQHLAQTQLRAAENGISVVQASVSGTSALIERDGSITKRTKLFERTVLSGRLSFGYPDSIYSKTGDWLSLCALLVVGYLSLKSLRKTRWKNQTSTN